MKRYSILLCLFIGLSTFAQSINQEMDGKKPYLIGKINKDGLTTAPYQSWFEKNYNSVQPDAKLVEQLKPLLPEYTIKAFLGTWCGDSRREVPRLYQVLDLAEFPLQRLTTVALDKHADHYRQSPGGEQEAMNVFRVPTIILFKDGKEVNRIVERPKVSIEADLLTMMQGEYVPNYQGVTDIMGLMADLGPVKFERRLQRTARNYKEEVEHYYGFSTLAKVWYADNKKDEAVAVTRLSCMMFPEEKGPKLLLASYLEAVNLAQEARILYNEVLGLEAENSTAKNGLKRLATK